MALESVVIGGAKRVVGCSSRTCNEAVRGDMGLDSLQGRRDTAKLKCGIKAGVFCTVIGVDNVFLDLLLKVVTSKGKGNS